ncbi:DUF4394 domain-containing protein [Mucilaginibacter sp. HD30]
MNTFRINFNKLAVLCLALTISISSCKKNNDDLIDGLGTGPNTTVYALSADNKLLTFTADNPSAATSVGITELQSGETIIAIDFRPATGQLYGVSSGSRIYVLNTQTGVAKQVGTTAFTPAISNSTAGFDFNPTVDRIRLVTTTGQNLRLHPETGTVAFTDGVTNGPISSGVSAAAYTNNRSGAATTELFVLDAATDKLYKQDPPNNGTLVAIGSGIGFDAEQIGGFDIGSNGLTLATIKVSGKTGLYAIDLITGKAARLRNDFAVDIIGLAIPTEPVAYAINSANELVIFNPSTPAPITKPITGMAAGETVLGIDFRPSTGQLFALGSTSRLYILNTSSGAAAAVGVAPFTTLLSGTDFGFDFNPTVDRVRIVSNTGQNLRINPNDGLVAAVDVTLSGTSPSITAAAYTNNFAGATTTVLYDIDTQANKLVKQDPPNAGTLVDVGPLGVTVTAANGFDIGSKSGTAYALLNVGGTTKLYTINLTTGAATAGATLTGTYKAFTLGLGF